MTELKPILQGRPTRGELRLLGSARIDVPRPGGVVRTVAALGLASSVTAAGGAAAASASGVGAAALAKWLAIGAVAGAAVTATGEAVVYRLEAHGGVSTTEQETIPRGSPAPTAKAPSARMPEATIEATNPDEIAVPASPDEPRAAVVNNRAPRNGRPPPLREPSAVAPATSPTLAEEVRALDDVRASLATNDARGALRLLDEFARRFARPRLGPEATLLRAQALDALGRHDEARRLTEKP